MAVYQFIHIEAYSLVTPKKAKAGAHSVSTIVAEAARTPGSCDHVSNPLPPSILYGEPLGGLEAVCRDWAQSVKDGAGKRLRKDAHCLLAGVISAPRDMENSAWNKLRSDSIKWLVAKYGDRLRTVVEHKDESCPHVHFFVVPRLGEPFNNIHDGKLAAASFSGTSKKSKIIAYKDAMRTFQSAFSEDVGLPNGMLKLGPRRRRLSRAEWHREKEQARNIAIGVEQIKREGVRIHQELDRAKRNGFIQGQTEAALEYGMRNPFARFLGFWKNLSLQSAALQNALQVAEAHATHWEAAARAVSAKLKISNGMLGKIKPKYLLLEQRCQALSSQLLKVNQERDSLKHQNELSQKENWRLRKMVEQSELKLDLLTYKAEEDSDISATIAEVLRAREQDFVEFGM
ncbi:plasmid recombination protein [Pseudomonas guariconensis]|uniref:plasmid recombination protein n=1 Tax=Pseudomonas guariconensis TaxID=1288410 RepID=UPI0039EAB7F5